ncbi:MAG: response regulator transcription factor [Verrucomicrobiota bacterium]
MTDPIRIMLVEDHPEYREIVNLALGREPDIELTSQFGTAERALQSMQDLDGSHHPDVILLDLNLPGISGLEAIPQFLATLPDVKIIILTQSDREADILQAIMLGASGYFLKSTRVREVTDGIRTVMAGGASLDAQVAKFVLHTLKSNLPKRDLEQLLTEREMEILTQLAAGQVKKEIAERFGISINTVVTHVSHIYEKLNVKNAPAAIAKAFQMGILQVGKRD